MLIFLLAAGVSKRISWPKYHTIKQNHLRHRASAVDIQKILQNKYRLLWAAIPVLALISYVLIKKYYFIKDGPIIEIRPDERVKKLKFKQETDLQPHYSIYNHCSNSQLRFRLAPEPENFIISIAKNSISPFAALETSAADLISVDGDLDITYHPSSKLQKLSAPNSSYYVQLAVTKTKTLAEEKWYNLSKVYKILTGRKHTITQYNAGDKGLFFVLRINSLGFEEANILCRKINNFGHPYCLVDQES